MPIECVVLDLDGTLTDVAREAPPFLEAFPSLVADLLGRDVGPAWQDADRRVREGSPELAWVMDGHAVAPADADPYVRASCVAQVLLDEAGVLVSDPSLRSEVISAIYRRAYRDTAAVFRREAREVVEALLGLGVAVRLVTNAATDVASAKLARLTPEGAGRVRVRGDARKFRVGPAARSDARFLAVPDRVQLPGLARPVLLGRGSYFDILAALWDETGASPETTLVCGDIFEMDLALPAALGAEVHLVRRERTYAYELDAIAALGVRGGVSDDLRALPARVAEGVF
jgi:phosphoglycolate phosphatase-like HAD superfamily hydrolase